MKITKNQLRRTIKEGLFGDRTSKHRSPKQNYQGKTKFKVEGESLYKMVGINTARDGQAMVYPEDLDPLIAALQAIKTEAGEIVQEAGVKRSLKTIPDELAEAGLSPTQVDFVRRVMDGDADIMDDYDAYEKLFNYYLLKFSR